MTTPTPYGAWPSSLAATDVAAGTVRLAWPRLAGDEVWWQEGRPAEGGRSVVVRRLTDGTVEDVLPSPWNARSRVHEYGCNPWLVVDGALVFANFADQRLWRLVPGSEPVALTAKPPVPAGQRYAGLLRVGQEVWCVRESHHDGVVSRGLVAVPLDGSGDIRELVSDTHFVAHPRLSPDGAHLAWIGWEHPQMPWDGALLRVAPVSDGEVGAPRTLLGNTQESVVQPEWVDDASLVAATDRSGWWNLVQVDLAGTVTPLHPAEEEFAGPMWLLGMRWFTPLADGRLLVRHGDRLGMLARDGSLTDLDLPFTSWSAALDSDGRRVVDIGASATSPACVVLVDPDGTHEVVHAAAEVPVSGRSGCRCPPGGPSRALVAASCTPWSTRRRHLPRRHRGRSVRRTSCLRTAAPPARRRAS